MGTSIGRGAPYTDAAAYGDDVCGNDVDVWMDMGRMVRRRRSSLSSLSLSSSSSSSFLELMICGFREIHDRVRWGEANFRFIPTARLTPKQLTMMTMMTMTMTKTDGTWFDGDGPLHRRIFLHAAQRVVEVGDPAHVRRRGVVVHDQ